MPELSPDAYPNAYAELAVGVFEYEWLVQQSQRLFERSPDQLAFSEAQTVFMGLADRLERAPSEQTPVSVAAGNIQVDSRLDNATAGRVLRLVLESFFNLGEEPLVVRVGPAQTERERVLRKLRLGSAAKPFSFIILRDEPARSDTQTSLA